MITRLRLKNFKNFADVELKLGPFTVILGTNASGKSNLRDAFRFLHGIGRGYSLSEIIGGKTGGGGQVEWERMRGAMREISRIQAETSDVSFDVTAKISGVNSIYRASIENFDGLFRFINEYFELDGREIFNFHQNVFWDSPAVSTIKDEIGRSFTIKNELKSMRFHEMDSATAKLASPPGQKVLGDRGENLPTVLQAICADPARKETLMEWVRALTPMDVVDFKFRSDLNGFIQLYLVESDGAEISAVSASDGTLRFLALLAALLGPNPAKLYFFEEIESGIHPARLHLLIDMLERQTAKSGIQVVTTTHSPELLSLLSDETLKSTSIVYRPPGRSDAIIKPVLDFPNIDKLRATQGLGRLHAAGWFEDILNATFDEEGDAE
ncbi:MULTISPECIES: AAA family ATPase [unclassified Azospirillum]|uniref:AAA family ATPase n=1 Tax=unclassified Azospirillum TaxID=2630922 RepID=UPI000B7664C1|nr:MULTISPECIES: ATP-binding protein [unclassified Azospirillum]SNS60882.1 Predicted ATPase [Azospirillum sp. RU38E]SNS80242.1 Predicted ATPase [Azospirillum sp. RU37A]